MYVPFMFVLHTKKVEQDIHIRGSKPKKFTRLAKKYDRSEQNLHLKNLKVAKKICLSH